MLLPDGGQPKFADAPQAVAGRAARSTASVDVYGPLVAGTRPHL